MIVGAFSASFGEGNGPVFGGMHCFGTESNLTQCSSGSIGQRDCHHGRDVGVICQGRVGLGVVKKWNCCSKKDCQILTQVIVSYPDLV